jgi:two-component system, OmpR family, response regulator
LRVLLVDDDPDLVKLMASALRREGYTVDTALNGRQALWLAGEAPYDAIVLDIGMPPPDGIEVLRQLRHGENWIPVLLVTGRDDVDDRVRGLDAGADDYLVKPFALAELSARLRALARRGQPPRPAVLAAGGVVLDPASRTVTMDATEVELTRREYALLELLVRNAGSVVSRDDITAKLWDFASDVTSNVVDVTVRRLREKIDRPFGSNQIESIRGVGYIFRPDR